MKYIDADKLIAEIERQMNECIGRSGVIHKLPEYRCLKNIHSYINSLQQEQPIDKNILTWRDVNDLERIINNVHYEFRNGIGEEAFGKLVLERFIDGKDDLQELPEVDLEKEYTEFVVADPVYSKLVNGIVGKAIARHFYELGQKEMRERIANPQYNQEVITKMKSESPTEELKARKEE